MIRQRLVGLAAALAILGVVVGLPALLLTIGASPVPSTAPDWQDLLGRLLRPDDGSAVIWLFTMAAWVAWAFLAVSIALEIVARLRGLRAPRLPGLRLPQAAAKGLVGAAVLLFAASPLVASAQPAPSGPAQPQTTHVAAVDVLQHDQGDRISRGDRVESAGKNRDTKERDSRQRVHVVKDGESLWSIAEDRLGDGERFREIAERNYGRTQDDGEHLTHNHAINVGWQLRLPRKDAEASAEARRPARQRHPGDERRVIKEGDTLWDIAEEELGSGERYPEIFRASRHIKQPGGYRLTDPDEISEGWTIIIPADGSKDNRNPTKNDEKADTKTDRKEDLKADRTADQGSDHNKGPNNGSTRRSGQTEPHRGEPPLPVDRVQPKSSTRPDQPGPSARPTASPTSAASPTPAGVPGTSDDTAPGPQADTNVPEPDVDVEEAFPVRTVTGVGTLVAAGVIGLIAVRRAQQQRRRPHRARLPMPEPDTAHTEQQLRAVADPLSVEIVDAALRGLARSCATAGQPLPGLRAARLTVDQLDLYLSEGAELPEPWVGTVDTTVWTLPADNAAQFITAEDLGSVPAPYPALVTIGHDAEDGHVLLDLEQIGSLELHGDPEATREVLAALAIELATSQWADDLRVTLVGAHPDLEEALQTGRIRYVPTVGRVLDDLSRRTEADHKALAAAGSPDLQHARITGVAPDAWAPDILLVAGPLTDLQRNRLAGLLDTTPRLAIAAVTTNTVLGGWSLDKIIDGRDTAILEPIGLAIQPQRVDSDSYAQILNMVAIATEPVEIPDTHANAEDDTRPLTPPVTLPKRTSSPAVESPPTETENAVAEQTDETAKHLDTPTAAVTAAGSLPRLEAEEPTPAADQREDISTGTSAMPGDELGQPPAEQVVTPLPRKRPMICVLGPVDLQNAAGTVEPSKRPRLLEYAAYLVLHPQATYSSIADAIWPNRTTQDNLNTRNTATSKLRKWLGENEEGEPYLPRHSYSFLEEVTSDWAEFRSLVGPDLGRTSTTHLEQALALVRGRPFDGVHERRYAWAEVLRQEMISAVVDVSYELAHRRLMDGRWRSAEEAVVVGINLEPGIERLWRLRILAAHEGRNQHSEQEAIDRLLVITDQLGSDLEPETERLLAALRDPRYGFDQLKEAL